MNLSLCTKTLALALALALFAGCSAQEQSNLHSDFQAGHSEDTDALNFRNIFAAYALQSGMSEEQVRHQVYLPNEKLKNLLATQSSGDMNAIDLQLRDTKPSQLFEAGMAVALNPVANPDQEFERRGPLTLVFFPGYYQEFFPNSFFDMMSPTSSLARDWQKALQKATPEQASDRTYDIQILGEKTVAMADLFEVGSIDDASGKPLINFIALKPQAGSGETIGNELQVTSTYIRRFEKLFQLLPIPKKMYLMGYSRGITLALDFTAAVTKDPSRYVWADRIKGAISLSGTIYGTSLADLGLRPETRLGKLVQAVNGVANELQSCDARDSTWARMKKTSHNTGVWAHWVNETRTGLSKQKAPAGYVLENPQAGNSDYQGIYGMLSNIAFNYMFDSSHLFVKYCHNIEQWKAGVHLVSSGLEMMSTEQRMNWFRTHTLPAGFETYSIAGVMGDSVGPNGEISPLANDPLVYGKNPSADHMTQRGGFYEQVEVGVSDLNDGMVPLSRAVFWPGLHKALNPAQPDNPNYMMGVLGNHHWGVFYQGVLPRKDKEHNLLSREILFRSIANFVAGHSQQ